LRETDARAARCGELFALDAHGQRCEDLRV
jgi:hypothetical protein